MASLAAAEVVSTEKNLSIAKNCFDNGFGFYVPEISGQDKKINS